MSRINLLALALSLLVVKGPIVAAIIRQDHPPTWGRVAAAVLLTNALTLTFWLSAVPLIWRDTPAFMISTAAIVIAAEALVTWWVTRVERFQLALTAVIVSNLAFFALIFAVRHFVGLDLLRRPL